MKIRWRFDWGFAFIFGVWLALACLICSVFGLCLYSLTAIGTWLLVLGVIFAWWQVRQLKSSTDAQLAVGLFQQLRSKETLTTVRFIYGLSPEDFQDLPEGCKNDIDSVLDKLDVLATLVIQGIVDETLAIEAYGGPLYLKCQYRLYGYIYGVRCRRGGRYCENTETFAVRIYHYYEKKERRYKTEDVWPKYYRTEGDPAEYLRDEFVRPDKKDKELFPIWFIEKLFGREFPTTQLMARYLPIIVYFVLILFIGLAFMYPL